MVAGSVSLSDASTSDLAATKVRANLVPEFSRRDALLKKQWIIWAKSLLARKGYLEVCTSPLLLPADWVLEQARFNLEHDSSLESYEDYTKFHKSRKTMAFHELIGQFSGVQV